MTDDRNDRVTRIRAPLGGFYGRVLIPGIAILLGMASAQPNGTLTGRVVDARTGQPLPAVNVILEGTGLGAATDPNGNFRVVAVPSGRQQVTASMVGYRTGREEIEITDGKAVLLDFWLEQSPVQMGAVVVTGTRTPRFVADAPVRTEVLTSRAIEERGARTVYEALSGAPGVRVDEQCQVCAFTELRMQGLGANHTQVLIDGQPIYSGLAGVYGLQQLGTADIDRIEIVKGAGSALYGSGAIAGGINIITRSPKDRPEATAGVELGSYGTNSMSLSAAHRVDKLGVALSAERNTGDIIDWTGDEESDRVSSDGTNLGLRLSVDGLTGNDRLSLHGRSLRERRVGGVLTEDLFRNPFAEGVEHIDTDRYETRLGYQLDLDRGGRFDITAAYTRHDRTATNDAFLGDYEEIHGQLPGIDEMRPYVAGENLYVAGASFLQPLPRENQLLFGVQFSRNELDESGRYVVVDEEDPLYGEAYTSTSAKWANDLGIFVQNEWRLGRMLEVVAGARYDFHDSRDEFRGSGLVAPGGVEPVTYTASRLNPRLALKLSPLSNLTLRGSAGTGFRVPYGFSEELHLCSGSPRVWKGADLRPERSVSYNLGFDYDLDRFAANLNLFRTDLRDAIAFTEAGEEPAGMGYTYEWENVGDARVQGVELGTRVAVLNNLVLGADLAFNDGRYAEPRDDWEETPYYKNSRYISRFPQLAGGLRLSYNPPGWSLSGDLNYQGRMYIDYHPEDEGDEPEIVRTEPHFLVNVRAAKTLFRHFEVYAGARNLTDYTQPDRRHDDPAFIYAPLFGRVVYGGLKVRL